MEKTTIEEVKEIIEKAPGKDYINLKLIKYKSDKLCEEVHKMVKTYRDKRRCIKNKKKVKL